ncbi:MAG: hypothetical protein EHM21_17680, partial [Chloroflexi bacterium]
MKRDFERIFDLLKESRYTHIVIWGLFTARDWPLDIQQSVSPARRKAVGDLLSSAHRRGLKVLSGLGVYSWGFDEIIRQRPHLARGNVHAMCPRVPEGRRWMEKVVDFELSRFDLDGVQMQSADLGRCSCQECAKQGNVEFHAALNDETATYIRSRWREKLIVSCNWGVSFKDPKDIRHLARMGRNLDVLTDYDASARGHTRRLIRSLPCVYATLAGLNLWPPQWWKRTKWFLPVTVTNAPYLKRLYADGGRGAEQFCNTLANPSDEVSARFAGKLLHDIKADPVKLLSESVEQTFETKTGAALEAVSEACLVAENGYFKKAGQALGPGWCSKKQTPANLFFLNNGLFPARDGGEYARYLYSMNRPQLAVYEREMKKCLRALLSARGGVGRRERWAMACQCAKTVLKDIAHARK